MTRAFVTGATGYTGREVVRILAEQGVETWAHVRPDSSRLEEWRERFEAMGARVDTTAWSGEALAQTLERLRPDLVFCLVGTTKKRGDSYEDIDYGLTAMLAGAAVDAGLAAKPGDDGARSRFVYLSASGVKEGSPLAYFQARWKAEQAVRDSGLEYVLVRPGLITGPGRDDARPLERFGGVVSDLVFGTLGRLGAKHLSERFGTTTNTELATRLVHIALDPAMANAIVENDALQRMPLR